MPSSREASDSASQWPERTETRSAAPHPQEPKDKVRKGGREARGQLAILYDQEMDRNNSLTSPSRRWRCQSSGAVNVKRSGPPEVSPTASAASRVGVARQRLRRAPSQRRGEARGACATARVPPRRALSFPKRVLHIASDNMIDPLFLLYDGSCTNPARVASCRAKKEKNTSCCHIVTIDWFTLCMPGR